MLVIENHALMREALCAAIASDPQLTISAPETTAAARAILPLQPGVALLAFRPDIVQCIGWALGDERDDAAGVDAVCAGCGAGLA